MFLELPPVTSHSQEWMSSSFETRLAQLKQGRVRVAYYYDTPDNSTFRYRVYNMIEVIRAYSCGATPELSAAWFCRSDEAHLSRIADAADIIVLCRARYSDRLAGLVTRARNLGRLVIFDVDDLVVDINRAHLLAYSLDQDLDEDGTWDLWFGYIGRVSAMMHLCDRVIATNEYLASRITECSNKSVSILPNFINKEQLNCSNLLLEAKKSNLFSRDDHIHVGYFSGSPSHNKDFEIAAPAISRIMATDKRVHLNIVGFLDIRGDISQFGDRIHRYPLQDYLGLQRLIATTEINIAPLQDNLFTNCKSELKYFEAAVVGTNTIASPTFAFSGSIADGSNGWLSANHEWEEKLSLAIDSLADDARTYELMAERARDVAVERFSWEKQYDGIRNVLLGNR